MFDKKSHVPMKVKDLLDGLEKADAKRIRYHIDKQPAPNVYAGWGNVFASSTNAWSTASIPMMPQMQQNQLYTLNGATMTTTGSSGMLGDIGRTF